ncbi:putative NADH-ubiquinone oxidoreductase subunit [Clavispora lusitaniae]|uniref:NADH-ubiquinone oxidoreductase subunit n=1 Tax=Clavispora lusitaniae TaxID=36911 RepID=A0ACD0WLG9_CLALS|nr:putative NADH-ubiquinone oxidoreductase subunit [Clavispora lusitaniae]QFZ33923.1 putative NADH-ubiquinone oxidoreductase subunit [Clavispora lusitaniae]QFZ39607.1 putative NADH-ubiquinone oxidoreductase subunit [Clavispora lusitaniae]QFZ45289.1 putative NADH-ubiquinone oxidoreductase subunit [Clavispora lusitaniae]QFZ50953.1 putative NADH-ubiquinone oxidoreductase subunit [Clavispora lusitaniae]
MQCNCGDNCACAN